MITSWEYLDRREKLRDDIKKTILDKKINAIDVGASIYYWSYPECRFSVDIFPINKDNNTHFTVNLENPETYKSVLDYVAQYGKFDFSICSHTLEDVFNPIDVIKFLQQISNEGFIAVPSKYNEFTNLYNNLWMGNAHHKQILDVIDDTIVIFPKYPFIEKLDRSKELLKYNKGVELAIFWKNEIPYRIFGNGVPFIGDDALIYNYYKELIG